MLRGLLSAFLASVLVVFAASPARAGGSPETTLVVANADSPISLRVAHAYRELRDLPANHVLYLEDVPETGVIDVETFRKQILIPIESWLETHGLADDIDTIAYATGFPYGVDFQGDVKAAGFKPGREISRIASLTGLTFLAPHVLAKDPKAYLSLFANRYFRQPVGLPRPGQNPAQRLTSAERRLVESAQGALRSKDWRRAAEAFQQLTESYPDQPAYWYDLACCRSLLGDPTGALDALERSVEAGFVRADHAEQDPDLTPLRGTERFLGLVARMREGAKSGSGLGRVETLSRGFSHQVTWDENGQPLAPDTSRGDGARYRLAVMLGWAGSHGNSLDEILTCLRRGRQSDGSFPDGGFYLMANPNVRATARMPFFGATVEALERLGFDAEILTRGQGGQNGTLPVGRPQISGITAGTASFQWPKDLPELLPGAIAEHLTSFGAHFGTSSQTKCTEFIRHGAAGTSGTVAEPFAIFMKFPLPFVHVHYARGCSMAEAFYQSVWGPYQLLVLGDPLARPYARFREVRFLDPDPASVWSGRVAVRAATTDEAQRAPAAYELWVDGRRTAVAGAGEPLAWDTTTVRDGTHDVRVVAIDASLVATRSVTQAWVTVKNHEASVTLEAKEHASLGEAISLQGKASGVETIEILQGARVVATTKAKRGRFRVEVPADLLGPGRVALTAQAGPVAGGAASAPVEIEISPTVLSTASMSLPGEGVLPGLRAEIEFEDGETRDAVVTTLARRGARSLGKDLAAALATGTTAKQVRVGGFLRLEEGVTEIALVAPGSSSLALDGNVLLETTAEARRSARVLLVPGGWHRIEVVAAGSAFDGLGVRIGGRRAAGSPRGSDLTHAVPTFKATTLPETVRGADSDAEVRLLHNGERAGKALYVSGNGTVFAWKRTERKVQAVVIFPARGKDAEPFPAAWVVETRSSPRGAWKKVKRTTELIAPGPEAPRKDKVIPPWFLEIRFPKTSARQLRVRPADPKATAQLTEIEIYRAR